MERLARAGEARPNYQLDGYVLTRGWKTALIRDNGEMVRISWSACEFTHLDEAQCNYRGWVVGRVGVLEKVKTSE